MPRSRRVYKASRRGRLRLRRRREPSFTARRARPGRTGRRWPKRTALGLGALVVVLFLGSVGGYVYAYFKLSDIPRVKVTGLTPLKSGQAMDVLLAGSESRSCQARPEQAHAKNGKAAAGQSDVVLVARLLPGGRIELLSIPHDTWVELAGTHKYSEIGTASDDGPDQLVATIQDTFHIPVNHVFTTSLCGFASFVTALGGIYMDFPDPARDAYSGLDVATTGCQLLDGKTALALVSSSHFYYYADGQWNYDGTSEVSRIMRQQAFLSALLDRMHAVFPNFFRLDAFIDATIHGLRVDSSLSSSELLSIGWKYHSISESHLSTSLLPTRETVVHGKDVLLPVPRQDRQVVDAFLAGKTKTFVDKPWNPYPC